MLLYNVFKLYFKTICFHIKAGEPLMTSTILDSLQILIVTLVLISLIGYSFLALYRFIKEKSLSDTDVMNDIFSFSLLWLTECTLIIFIYIYFCPEPNMTTKLNLLLPLVILFTINVLSTGFYFGKQQLFSYPVKILLMSINVGLLLVLFLKMPILTVLKILLIFYVFIFITFTYFTYKKSSKFSIVRTYYSVFCILLLFFINLFEHRFVLSFYLTINLCLYFFLTISFCLYYAEVYTSKLLLTSKDIAYRDSELIEAEKRIQYLAYTHPDTGLKNAHKFHVDIKNCSSHLTGICMLNIKNFKLLLTLTGYRESKSILEDISKALISHLQSDENLYHFSTDRFIILYQGPLGEFEDFIKGILAIFSKNNLGVIDLNPCIGATSIRDFPLNHDKLVKELELASHISKYSTQHYTLYVPAMSKTLEQNLDLETRLKEATYTNHWEVYLQPKVNVLTNQIIGAEALIRWKDHETTITPSIFIPLAEKLGLISQIGRYVIDTTFQYVHHLETIGLNKLKFSINLSVQQLMEVDLVEYIENAVARYNIPPQSIIFEITESVLIHNITKVNTTVTQLKYLGFRFSLDDFGTGYSSLSYLSKLNFDELKFDKEFIRNIQFEEKNLLILEHVTKMGQNLGLDIVTEGIEDELQYNTIKSLGCDYYQGYYHSRPIPFNHFLDLVTLPIAK
jgi:EAL domain-containing protein (putative c-di-GMP-specific phosphodiesterase class I)/GGDEF domain-containing protein